MAGENENELYAEAINNITEQLSEILLKEFSKLPSDLQKGLVLIKSSQLLLANVLCQVAMNKDELEEIAAAQGEEMRELIFDCAVIGFAKKFGLINH